MLDNGDELCNDPDRPEDIHSVADPEDCSVFYKCVPLPDGSFLSVRFECPEGTGYDAELGV